MKVMISQSMRGKTEEQIREERADTVKKLEEKGWEVVDTIFTEEPPKDSDEAVYYLAKSIEMMSKVDAVVFIGDWQSARGCRIEYQVANEYDKFIKCPLMK